MGLRRRRRDFRQSSWARRNCSCRSPGRARRSTVQRRKVWLPPTTKVPCSKAAAKTRNPLKSAGVPQTHQQISAVSRPKFTILSGHVEEVLMFNNYFPIVDICLSAKDILRQSCAMVTKWRFFASFCVLYFQRAACSKSQTCILNSH